MTYLEESQEDQETGSCNLLIDEVIVDNDIEIPQSLGVHVEDCHQNPNYNACIYDETLFIENGSLRPEFRDIFSQRISLLDQLAEDESLEKDPSWIQERDDNIQKFDEAMRSHQTYAVNITGTTPVTNPLRKAVPSPINLHGQIVNEMVNFLQNAHYNVNLISSYMPPSDDYTPLVFMRLTQRLDNKWAIPYATSYSNRMLSHSDFLESLDYLKRLHSFRYDWRHFSVEQVMAYYYLMYQKEWMELNAGQWHASGRDVFVSFDDFESAYFQSLIHTGNRIEFLWNASPSTSILFNSLSSINVGLILHEAAHANFDYAHYYVGDRLDFVLTPSYYCEFMDGCAEAINEGQADFNVSMIFPGAYYSFESDIKREIENPGMGRLFFDDLGNCFIRRHPRYNKEITVEEAFNCQLQGDNRKGEVHDMGTVYASIWWEIYNHPGTSKKDIATLFSEHLPLTSNDDTFKTVGLKIAEKALELFDGPKGMYYACIISQEFSRRGLNLSKRFSDIVLK